MDRWQNKIAVVTGASSGIGAAIAKDLVKAGLIVVGLARREQRVVELKNDLPPELRNNLRPVKCDVSKEDEVKKVFSMVEKQLGGVDVLVNNAGIVRQADLVAPDSGQIVRDVVETNIMGVSYCTREAFNIMKKHNPHGHILIINSIAGHSVTVLPGMGSFNIYSPSKYAVTAMTEVYRREFYTQGTKIKITSISPGFVETEILGVEARKNIPQLPSMNAEDISSAVIYAISTPPHVQIHEMIIKPIGELI